MEGSVSKVRPRRARSDPGVHWPLSQALFTYEFFSHHLSWYARKIKPIFEQLTFWSQMMSAYQLYKCTMKSVLHSPTYNKVLSINWLHAAISKGPYSKSYGFSSSHVWMWELDHKEGWKPENWYFATVVLEKALESPWDCRDIKPVNPKGNQPWIFIGRTDAEAPILWPPDVKTWLIGKDWCWEGLKAGGEGGDRGWDVWMISLTQWTWVWANSGRWGRIGKPGVLWQINPQFSRLACESESRSVVSNSLQPHGLYSPWNSPVQD